MFQYIFHQIFNFQQANLPQTKNEEAPNVDYVLHYGSDKDVEPDKVSAQFDRLTTAQKNNRETVEKTISETVAWLSRVDYAKPQTRLYARQIKVGPSSDQAEKNVIVLYKKEVSDFPVIAFFQDIYRSGDAALARKVFSDLEKSIQDLKIERVDALVSPGAQELGSLVNCRAALSIKDLHTALYPYDTSGIHEKQPNFDANERTKSPFNSDPASTETNPQKKENSLWTDVSAEVDRATRPELEPDGNAEGFTASTGDKSAFLLSSAPSPKEPEPENSFEDGATSASRLSDITAAPETGVDKNNNSETGNNSTERNQKHNEWMNAGRKPSKAKDANNRSKPKKVKDAVIENGDEPALTCTQAAASQIRMSLGDSLEADDLRSADMFVLSVSGLSYINPALSNDFVEALPPKVFNSSSKKPTGVPISIGKEKERTRFFVPLADMLPLATTEPASMETLLMTTISEVDVLWEAVSSLAAEKKIKKLVVIPSYPLDLDERSSQLLAKTMLGALHRGLQGHADVEIKFAPRDLKERKALEVVIRRLNNAG